MILARTIWYLSYKPVFCRQYAKLRVTKTKKSISELPKIHLQPDGSPAQPLGEYISGDSVSPKKRVRRGKAEDSSKFHLIFPSSLLKSWEVITGQPRNILSREILENLRRFPHCLLLTRVGSFYEVLLNGSPNQSMLTFTPQSYFDQATEIAKLLNIKLTSRKWDGHQVAMCGFPLMHLDKYLKVLVQQEKRFVAMCEEFPRYSSNKSQGLMKEFDRRVARVITPGTFIDETFLNPYENNYLLAISPPRDGNVESFGLAWIDVSTGEFFSKATTVRSLRDEITRIAPREIVLNVQPQSKLSDEWSAALKEDNTVISYLQDSIHLTPQVQRSEIAIPDEIVPFVLESSPSLYSPQESAAIDILTTYLRQNLLEHMPALMSPNKEDAGQRMQIDSHTIKALEIRERILEGSSRGSLLSAVKRTVTTGGTRLLARWLCQHTLVHLSFSLTAIQVPRAPA